MNIDSAQKVDELLDLTIAL